MEAKNEKMLALEQKWCEIWTKEGKEPNSDLIMGVDLAEEGLGAAIYKDGKPVIIKPKGCLPDDFNSPDCSAELHDAFLMRMLNDSAEEALGTRVSKLVVVSHGEISFIRNQSYRNSAEMAGIGLQEVLTDVVMAAHTVGRETEQCAAVILVDKTHCGVCVVDFGSGLVRSVRGSFLKNPMELIPMLDSLYAACLESAKCEVSKAFVCGKNECVASFLESSRKTTGVRVEMLKDPETAVMRGAAILGGLCCRIANDERHLFEACEVPVGFELANGTMKTMVDRETMSAKCWVWPENDENGGLSVNFYEGHGRTASQNRFLGSLSLAPGVGRCEVELAFMLPGILKVFLSRGDDFVYGKITYDGRIETLGNERLTKGLPTICDVCHGDPIECEVCHGSTTEVCSACGGEGRQGECGVCNGTGTSKALCSACDGSGYNYDFDPPVKCEVCGGKGHKPCSSCAGTGIVECSSCQGTGKVACHACKGEGEIPCSACEKRQKEAVEKAR